MSVWLDKEIVPGVPTKTQHIFTKHETIAFCSIVNKLFDSQRVSININFDTLASPICEIFFKISRSKDRNVFFQRADFRQF